MYEKFRLALLISTAAVLVCLAGAQAQQALPISVEQFDLGAADPATAAEDRQLVKGFCAMLRTRLAASGGKYEVHNREVEMKALQSDPKLKLRPIKALVAGTVSLVRTPVAAAAQPAESTAAEGAQSAPVAPPAVTGMEVDARVINVSSGEIVAVYHCSVKPDSSKEPQSGRKQSDPKWQSRSPQSAKKVKFENTDRGRMALTGAKKIADGLVNDVSKIESRLQEQPASP